MILSAATEKFSPITYENVVFALGDLNPVKTNAAALRLKLGRGSLGTIQRHLNTIRIEHEKTAETVTVLRDTPPAPPEALAIWPLAYSAAVAQVRERLDAIVEQRDRLVENEKNARDDMAMLATEIESLEAEVTTAAASAVSLEQQTAASAEKAALELSTALTEAALALQHEKDSAEAMQALLSDKLSEALHKGEIEELKSQAAIQTLQAALDRLVGQLADFKSALHKPS